MEVEVHVQSTQSIPPNTQMHTTPILPPLPTSQSSTNLCLTLRLFWNVLSMCLLKLRPRCQARNTPPAIMASWLIARCFCRHKRVGGNSTLAGRRKLADRCVLPRRCVQRFQFYMYSLTADVPEQPKSPLQATQEGACANHTWGSSWLACSRALNEGLVGACKP
jgi:hypothetical protein